jgi:hypothetical protein
MRGIGISQLAVSSRGMLFEVLSLISRPARGDEGHRHLRLVRQAVFTVLITEDIL